MAANHPHLGPSLTPGIFDRVVCGVSDRDGPQVAELAARLASPDGRLTLVRVEPESVELAALRSSTAWGPEVHAPAGPAVERARIAAAAHHAVDTRVLFGRAVPRLLAEIEAVHATLVVVGAGPRHRAAGAVLGSVATHLVHDTHSAILVVRNVSDVGAFPNAIVVGDDGSRHAAGAVEVAGVLADRFGALLRILVAVGGDPVDAAGIAGDGSLERDDRHPVDALVAASEGVDLVVVGSRGLHGFRGLGSVSERVAHAARCSVLIVR